MRENQRPRSKGIIKKQFITVQKTMKGFDKRTAALDLLRSLFRSSNYTYRGQAPCKKTANLDISTRKGQTL